MTYFSKSDDIHFIFKLLTTKTSHRPTQYKKIIDTLPLLCADKNYQCIDDVIQKEMDQVEADFMPTYPDATRWSNIHHVEIVIIDLSVAADANTGLCSPIVTLLPKKTHL